MSWITPEELARALGLSVKTLRRQLADAPPNLSGAPILLGAGRTNRFLRWRSMEDAERWLVAFTEWRLGSHATSAPVSSPESEPRAKPARSPSRRVESRGQGEDQAVDWGSVRSEMRKGRTSRA